MTKIGKKPLDYTFFDRIRKFAYGQPYETFKIDKILAQVDFEFLKIE